MLNTQSLNISLWTKSFIFMIAVLFIGLPAKTSANTVYDYSSGGGTVYDYSSGGGTVSDYPSSYVSPSAYSSNSYGATPKYSDYSSYYPSYDYGSYGCPSCGVYDYTSYGGYSAPSYSYTPQPTYQYVPYSSGSGGYGGGYVGNNNVNPGASSGGQSQYVYSSNENTNTNANTNNNTITNTFNPTNNNDARINLIVYGGGAATAPAQEQTYQNYQMYTPTYVPSYAPNYTYDTSYTNTSSYTPLPPAPTYVSYASNNTQNQNQNLGTPVSGVFLSQVPATGVGFGFKMTLFSVGLVLWSLFAAYMISRKKNGAFANKINAFKIANMQKKGIVA
jgi:hypothetical protein